MWHHTSEEHNKIQAASCRFLQAVTLVQFMRLEVVVRDSDTVDRICYKNNGFKQYKGSMLEHVTLKTRPPQGKLQQAHYTNDTMS